MHPSTRQFMRRIRPDWRAEGEPPPRSTGNGRVLTRPVVLLGRVRRSGEAMATFDVPVPRATFLFDDPPFSGGEMDADVALSPKVYFGMKQWLEQLGSSDLDAVMAAAKPVAELFIEHARPVWNLTLHGEPLPTTVDALLALDFRLLSALVSLWIDQFGKVPLPLPAASTPGPENRAARRNRKPRGSTGGSSTPATRSRRSTPPTTSASGASST